MKNDSGRIGWNRLAALLRETLFYWRFIVILCILCALLAGAVQTVRMLSNMKKSEESTASLTEEEQLERLVYEKGAEILRTKIKSREEYLANTAIIDIDPYRTAVAEVNFKVSVDESNQEIADAVTNSLSFFIRREIDWTDLIYREGSGADYYQELVFVTTIAEDDIVNIKIRHYDEEKAGIIADYVVSAVKKRDEELQEELGSHDFEIMNRIVTTCFDSNYADWAETQVNRLATLQTVLESYEEKLEELAQSGSGFSKKAVLKMAVYGAFGGGLAALFLILLKLMQKNCLLDAGEIRDSYGVPLLAVFPQKRKQRKFLSNIDEMIAKIGRYPTEKLSDGERYAVIAEKVRQLAGPEKGKKLVLVGDVPSGLLKHTAEGLSAEMKGAEVSAAPNIAVDPASIRAVGTSDAVILVAGRGKSRCAETDRAVEAVRDLGVKIVGGIVAC